MPNAAAPNNPWRTKSTRLHHTLFALFIGGVLAYGAGFASYMLVRFDLVNLIRDVNLDDSFYYFQIASNLAAGKFSTFDGGITRTNGYHPLWMLLITPFYWIFDKEAALFGIKAFEIMLISAGAALVVIATRLARLPWILLFALPPLLYSNPALFWGMEAAAALFMLGLFFLNLCLYAQNSARWKWSLAAVAFALPWVRLEYAAVSLATVAALYLIKWSRQKRSSTASWKESVRSCLRSPPLLGACAGILVYFAYNGLVFGGIVPVSGAVKRSVSQHMWEQTSGYSLTQNFLAILRSGFFDDEIWVAMEVCAYVLLVWWFARHSRSRQDRLLLTFLVCMLGLAAGHLAKFAQIVLTMNPTYGVYDWYFVPAFLMMALIVPVRCYVAIYFICHFIEPRSSRAARLLKLGSVLTCAVFLLMEADFAKSFRDVNLAREKTHQEWEITSYAGVLTMNRTLPEGSVIGAWDAGVIGYFSRFPVVNLDGLVNSYDYFRRMKSGGNRYRKGRFNSSHQEFGITFLASTDVPFPANTVYEGASFVPFSLLPTFRQSFKFASFEPLENVDTAAWFWERIAPHFDFQLDDVGIVVDGRLAQLFTRDCMPGEQAIWVYAEQGNRRTVQPWVSEQTGVCTAMFVLPHNALPLVRLEKMFVKNRKLAMRSNFFDVYTDLARRKIYYNQMPCLKGVPDATFFLYIEPVDVNDLPDSFRQSGFHPFYFDFDRYGSTAGGACKAEVPLPDYHIAGIRTGQHVPGEDPIWQGRFGVRERIRDHYQSVDASSNQWHFGTLHLVGEQFIGQFEDGLDGWLLADEAVTNQSRHEQKQHQILITGSEGRGFLTTYHFDKGDAATGQARARVFIPESDHYLVFLIAGGEGIGVGLRLWADEEEIMVWRGENTEDFKLVAYPLAEVAGRRLHLEMFDDETGGWGHIMLDHVMLARRNMDDPEDNFSSSYLR